jgi:VanZ family protein
VQSVRSNRWRWIAVILMMTATFLFGTDLFSAENTRPIIRWIMKFLFGESADQKIIGGGEGLLRKSAHFLEYALLAVLWFRALRGDSMQPWRLSWVFLTFLVTVAWATVDELQQAFISTQRTGSPWDVLLDSCGALTGLVLALLVSSLWRK